MSLLAELKRRNVFRMAILYVVGAWLILRVGDLLFDLMGLPDWALRIVLGILILGFPVALAFSWLYELTPEGLKLERDVDRSTSITQQTGKKLNAIDLLSETIASPGGLTRWELKLDPRWDFLRDNKRFQALTEVEATIR